MNVTDFVTKEEYQKASEEVKKKLTFKIGKSINHKGVTVEARIAGKRLEDASLIKNIWKGKDYLIYIDCGVGTFGYGYAQTETEMFDSWQAFTRFFDKTFGQSIPDYVPYTDVVEQLSMF